MKKYELTQYELVKVRVDHKPLRLIEVPGRFVHWLCLLLFPGTQYLIFGPSYFVLLKVTCGPPS